MTTVDASRATTPDAGVKVRSGKWLASLASLRYVAAVAVLIHHCNGRWPEGAILKAIAEVGWIGVSFFFILSGFVLRWTFDPKISWGRFMCRRVSRIYPMNWLGLAASMIAYRYFGPVAGAAGGRLATAADALLVQDWIPWHSEMRQSWNGVSWTLSCEMFFYVLAPIIFSIGRPESLVWRTRAIAGAWAGMLTLAVCVVCAGDAGKPLAEFLLYHPLPRLLEFVMGALGAEWVIPGRRLRFAPVLGAIALFSAGIFIQHDSRSLANAYLLNLIAAPAFLGLIMHYAAADARGRRGWTSAPALVLLGESSYAFYVVHAVLVGALFYASRPALLRRSWVLDHPTTAAALMTGLALALATAASIVLHLYFEIPLRRKMMQALSWSGTRQAGTG